MSLPLRLVTAEKLPRPRLAAHERRPLGPVERVAFVARCPVCGGDCDWLEERVEARVIITVDCECGADAPPQEPAELTATAATAAAATAIS